jgi:hypothetical protein
VVAVVIRRRRDDGITQVGKHAQKSDLCVAAGVANIDIEVIHRVD